MDALNHAITSGDDPRLIAEAEASLALGDDLRSIGVFKDAMKKFKGALVKGVN
ncbi:MAG: hypothetical protein ACXAD7_15810 [Candidatus Kariarchaeaceae archaeon]